MLRIRDQLGRVRNSFDPDTFPRSLPRSADDLRVHDRFVGFNREYIRASVVLNVVRELGFDAILETGTHLGATSLLLGAQTELPIYTCEVHPKYYRRSKLLLLPFGGRIRTHLSDSRDFLTRVLGELGPANVFIYLDAHWYEDLPLLGELEIIERLTRECAVLIDDFRVPGDDGYGYDQYAAGNLQLSLVQGFLEKSRLQPFFPLYDSHLETAKRRGWILLATPGNAGKLRASSAANFIGPRR